MTDPMKLLARIDGDDCAAIHARELADHSRHLSKFWRVNGRLPYPSGNDVREAYEALAEIVAGLNEKKRSAA